MRGSRRRRGPMICLLSQNPRFHTTEVCSNSFSSNKIRTTFSISIKKQKKYINKCLLFWVEIAISFPRVFIFCFLRCDRSLTLNLNTKTKKLKATHVIGTVTNQYIHILRFMLLILYLSVMSFLYPCRGYYDFSQKFASYWFQSEVCNARFQSEVCNAVSQKFPTQWRRVFNSIK